MSPYVEGPDVLKVSRKADGAVRLYPISNDQVMFPAGQGRLLTFDLPTFVLNFFI